MQTVSGVRIAGTGHYLPGSPITQDELRTRFRAWPDCLPERVRDALLAESGIQTRYFGVALDGSGTRESNASMAARAGRRALEAAGWTPRDVDLLIVTTVIPDQLIPPTSTLVQQALGIPVCMELEISANCTAPYKALQVAANQLRLGEHRRALVCSVQFVSFLGMPPWASPERMTPSQAQLRWILSDGAGAIALERGDPDIELRTWIESRATNRRPGMELQLGAGYADLAGTIARGGITYHSAPEGSGPMRCVKESPHSARCLHTSLSRLHRSIMPYRSFPGCSTATSCGSTPPFASRSHHQPGASTSRRSETWAVRRCRSCSIDWFVRGA